MSSEVAEYEKNKKLYELKKAQVKFIVFNCYILFSLEIVFKLIINKKTKILIKFEVRKKEVDLALAQFQKRVNEIEQRKIHLDNQVARLTEDLNNLLRLHPKVEADLKQKFSIADVESKNVLDVLNTHKSRLNHMKSHMAEMKNSMDEMAIGKTNMLKNIDKLNLEIENLE